MVLPPTRPLAHYGSLDFTPSHIVVQHRLTAVALLAVGIV